MSNPRDALVTGIGLVSCLGEGVEATIAALDTADTRNNPVVDSTSFPPWHVHPMVPLDFDKQIPKRGDQRQMEPWQRYGVYAAGLALDSAGLKGNTDLLGQTELIVAAGGGERDNAVDSSILAALRTAEDPGRILNERLMSDLRPTLFLAQLSNLAAGNVSIVHGVVGSSRTLMGEETSGADVVRIACARISAGQGDLFLVGSSYNAERAEAFLQYELAHLLLRDRPFAGVWSRQAEGGGMVLGSLGCFLVIESRAHAEARGAPPVARIAAIKTGRTARRPGDATRNAMIQVDTMRTHLPDGESAVLSGAAGIAAATMEERAFLDNLRLPIRATASAIGHTMESSFPANIALAAAAVARGRLFPPLDAGEAPMEGKLSAALVTGWGHWRGESSAVVDRAA